MSVFYKFQDIFQYLLVAPDKESFDKMVAREFEMSDDFINELTNIKNTTSKVETDAAVNKIIFGKHVRFARELAEILDAFDKESSDRVADYLLDKMERYRELLQSMQDAPTKEERQKIIQDVLEEIENYDQEDFYKTLRSVK